MKLKTIQQVTRFLTTLIMAMSLTQMVLAQEENPNQQLTQTVRGTIVDADSRIPVVAAYVMLVSPEKTLGAVTDLDGNFKVENVPVGRYDIKFTCLAYQEKVVPNVMVGSGKELVLNIDLQETTMNLDEITVLAEKEKNKTNSDLAMISARGFTVEETKRYAGSLDDPARMASSYAGVSTVGDGNNDIIIRGNSPKGLLWRLEGVEIPNPNHFANDGASGGPISVLNSNILSNSDFFTGAFPAPYGNAYSGVFDIQMRKGNNEKREYAVQLGALGTDLSAEGPFKKGKQGSYLVNYRYSTLAMLTAIGVDVAGDNIPKYQDASFKVHLPTEKMGVFTAFGTGGLSNIHVDMTDENDNDKLYHYEDFNADMGVIGLSNMYFLGKKSYLKSTVSVSTSGMHYSDHDLISGDDFYERTDSRTRYSSLRVQTTFNRKINAKHSYKVGAIHSTLTYDLFEKYRWASDQEFMVSLDDQGSSWTGQTFGNWKYRMNDQLTFTGGLHYMYFNLNDNQVIEPRIGMRWQYRPKHAFTAGFGVHSRMESLSQYMAKDEDTGLYPNKNLDFTKARHYVVGYQYSISPNLFFTTELYYQDLFDVPVEDDPNSSISLLNASEGFTTRPLVNKGTGNNYGIDLTLERYFTKGYYFLITNSFYNSTYEALDGVERETRFNGQFVSNVLAGKEFDISRNGKNRTFTASIKGSVAGGNRYTPLDYEASIEENRTVYDEDRFLANKMDTYKRFDVQLSIRTDKKKTTRSWKLDVQNVTNHQNVTGEYYNYYTGEFEEGTQLGLLPVLSYKVEF